MKFKFCIFLLLLSPAFVMAQPAKHVVLISIDGMRPDFYMSGDWNTPNLHRLKEKGVFADGINSIMPSVTYPAHTTLVTGAYPGRHGIYYNVSFNEPKDYTYWESSYIKVPTLWDAVRKAGLKSASVMWPVAIGAPIDYNFPVKRGDNDKTTDQLSVTRPYVTPAGLIDEFEQNATGKLKPADFNDDMDITTEKMASYLIKTYKPGLTTIHFIGADHAEHVHGRDAAEVHKVVEQIDGLLGKLLKTIDVAGLTNSTAIIITGDHGFVDNKKSFSPNVYLARNGLITDNKNWKAIFYAAGGSTFLYLKDKNDMATLAQVNKILAGIPAEERKLFRVVDRAGLNKIGANPDVALALAFEPGIVGADNIKGEPVKDKKTGGSHGYYPDFYQIKTGFIAVGAGIAPHKQITGNMGIKDVAPLVVKLLNLNFKSPDGVLIPGILK